MIDTHAHIDDEQYQADLDAFLHSQQEAGVECILVPGVDASSIVPVAQVCGKYPEYLLPGIGLHPENVQDDWEKQLAALHDELTHREALTAAGLERYVAIGEIGLDYHFDTTYKEQQYAALREQLNWAKEYDLPVMLHVRDATEDALSIVKEFTNSQTCKFTSSLRGVMHCWSGSNEVAKQLVGMGLYLGIGGVITFKNCRLRDNLAGVPLERLVLETDAPYMAPVPHRGERNESKWIRYVMEELSKVYGVSVDEIDRITTFNAKTLFGL